MAGCCCRSAVLLMGFCFFIFISYHPLKAQENNIKLTEENWLQITQGEWMIKFFAPWCPACRNVAQNWNEFSNEAVKLGVKVAEVDVTKSSGVSGRFMISALPTFYHVVNGEFRKYSGGRSVKDFLHFIQEKKWKEIEPVSSWKSPNSFIMKCMGYVIKLSTHLKDAHVMLTEKYGLPSWGSYAVFGLVTVLIGLLLGVLIVVVTDMVYKPQYQGPPPSVQTTPPPEEPQPDKPQPNEPQSDEPVQDNQVESKEEDVEIKTIETTNADIPESGKEQIPVTDETQTPEEDKQEEIAEEEKQSNKDEEVEKEKDEADAAMEEDNVTADEKKEKGEGEEEKEVVKEEEKEEEQDEMETAVVDELIEDKEEDEDHEQTEVRKRKPKSSGD